MENLTLPSRYSNDLIIKEMQVVVEREKPINSSLYSSVWPTLKPFVNGGATGTLIASGAYLGIYPALYYMRRHVPKYADTPEFAAIVRNLKLMPVRLLCEATNTAALLGSFEILTKIAITANDGRPLSLYQEACCGLTSGAFAGYLTYPFYLAHNRMRADATLPTTQLLNYRNTFGTLYRIAADEGVSALWKGANPILKGTLPFFMGMLASYNRSIDYFRESLGFDETRAQFGASAASGFFAVACGLPYVHVLKEMQNMQRDANGKYPYTGSLHCALKILKSRGPFQFYAGFPMFFATMAPKIMVTWIVVEQIRKLESSIGL